MAFIAGFPLAGKSITEKTGEAGYYSEALLNIKLQMAVSPQTVAHGKISIDLTATRDPAIVEECLCGRT